MLESFFSSEKPQMVIEDKFIQILPPGSKLLSRREFNDASWSAKPANSFPPEFDKEWWRH